MSALYPLLDELKAEYPKFQLKSKSSSTFMKLLHWGLLIITFGQMKTFMTRFTTTVGYTIYTPAAWEGWSEKVKMLILRHERVHMAQRKRLGWRFGVAYLFLPFPVVWAYYRMKYEMEAYEVTVRAKWEYFGRRGFTSEAREAMIKRFTGPQYFWTWPWRKRVEKWYDDMVSRYVDV